MTDLDDALGALPAISLAQIDSAAALMTRVDRKYLVPPAVLAELIDDLLADMSVLEIDALRAFHYRTVYFDTADFAFFRQHVQRRRNRFKVRTRTYCDSGGSFLEVKSKGLRGATVKRRIAHDRRQPAALDAPARAFVAGQVDQDAAALRPVLQTDYRRITLVGPDLRITVDRELTAQTDRRRARGPAAALVEVKSASPVIDVDRALHHRGLRPHSVSKYCASAALLYPHLPGNDWRRMLRRHWALEA